ncbi:MAG: hypothetical protein WBI07_07850 [Mobilitalea sp.]
MWKGTININGVQVSVEAHESQSGYIKDWGGVGKVIGNDFLHADMYDTELGQIIINYIDYLSGNFTFVGSGVPMINLN